MIDPEDITPIDPEVVKGFADLIGKEVEEDGLYKMLREKNRKLEAEVSRLKADNQEFQSLFDMQHRRFREASSWWRRDKGEKEIWPDLGELIKWLFGRFRYHRELEAELKKMDQTCKELAVGSDEWEDRAKTAEAALTTARKDIIAARIDGLEAFRDALVAAPVGHSMLKSVLEGLNIWINNLKKNLEST